jgi:hypothetical protein
VSNGPQSELRSAWARLGWTLCGLASSLFLGYALVVLGSGESTNLPWDFCAGLVGFTGLGLTIASIHYADPLATPRFRGSVPLTGIGCLGGLRRLLGLLAAMIGVSMAAAAIQGAVPGLLSRAIFAGMAIFLFWLCFWSLRER